MQDHLFETGLITDFLEDIFLLADETSFEPEWSGSQSDDPDMGIDDCHIFQKTPIHAIAIGSNEMSFIHYNEIKCSQITGLVIDRLNACDNDRIIGISRIEPGGIDAQRNLGTERVDFSSILLQQFLDMRQNQNSAIPLLDGIRYNSGDDH